MQLMKSKINKRNLKSSILLNSFLNAYYSKIIDIIIPEGKNK